MNQKKAGAHKKSMRVLSVGCFGYVTLNDDTKERQKIRPSQFESFRAQYPDAALVAQDSDSAIMARTDGWDGALVDHEGERWHDIDLMQSCAGESYRERCKHSGLGIRRTSDPDTEGVLRVTIAAIAKGSFALCNVIPKSISTQMHISEYRAMREAQAAAIRDCDFERYIEEVYSHYADEREKIQS